MSSNWAATRGEKWRAHIEGMEAMFTPIDEPLLHALQLDAPGRIADIGCGGGPTTREVLRRAPAGSVVHGFDISPTLIELARRRLAGARGVVFETADMAIAPAPAEPYDRLVSRFGVMFFDDPPAAFSNLVRWLAPGGRFAFAVWGPTADNPWMTIVRQAVASVVDVPSNDPEAPGPFRYGNADKLLALLDRAGFSELEVRDWRGTLPLGGALPAAEAAEFAISSFSTFAELLDEAGDEALVEARRVLTAGLSEHLVDGAVRMDARVHLVSGARPGSR
jgi:SAM-dependent methyltransferase